MNNHLHVAHPTAALPTDSGGRDDVPLVSRFARTDSASVRALDAPRLPALTHLAEGLNAAAAATLAGVSKSKWWDLHADGLVPSPCMKVGRVVRWSHTELIAWMRSGCPARNRWQHARDRAMRQLVGEG